MCGIAGLLDPNNTRDEESLRVLATAMADRLRHRGPDDGGAWVDAAAGVALGHRRLAIVDLSPAGHQPMISSCGRLVLAYNGELYNFADLRAELEAEGRQVEGGSDTRVLLEACAAWGAEATLPRLRGMFAFALWDRDARRLTLARDRIGIKPLYWGRLGQAVVFGSELKALHAHPEWRGEVDRQALAAYLRFGYVPRELCLVAGLHKLLPGHVLTVDEQGRVEERAYWELREVVRRLRAAPPDPALADPAAATDRLEAALRDSIRRHMVSDVPLGAFLSGGYDSSVVAALMQAESSRPVRTFSIGSPDPLYDESRYAREVAAHLGTEHTDLIVEPSHALEVIPRLAELYDEPFGDASQVPTFLVSELTRRHVTVALSGDGGDELFLGYNRYYLGDRFRRTIARLPRLARAGAGRALRAVPPERWDALLDLASPLRRRGVTGDRLHKLAKVLTAADLDAFYLRLVSQWDDPAALVPGAAEPPTPLDDPSLRAVVPHPLERMAFLDLITYLPEDILTKVDRASMGVSLEARVPLLDHEVVELAWRLPAELKFRDGERKWLLRQVLYRHVPRRLVDRPKTGFGIPIDAWLRGPLRDWAEDLLSEEALGADGLLDPGPIRRRWTQHLSGRRNWQYPLWAVLMLQQWRRARRGEAG